MVLDREQPMLAALQTASTVDDQAVDVGRDIGRWVLHSLFYSVLSEIRALTKDLV